MAKKPRKNAEAASDSILLTTEVGSLSGVARMVGVPVSTLNSAVKRGYVLATNLGCGLRVVSIESAQAWSSETNLQRRTGPKPG